MIQAPSNLFNALHSCQPPRWLKTRGNQPLEKELPNQSHNLMYVDKAGPLGIIICTGHKAPPFGKHQTICGLPFHPMLPRAWGYRYAVARHASGARYPGSAALGAQWLRPQDSAMCLGFRSSRHPFGLKGKGEPKGNSSCCSPPVLGEAQIDAPIRRPQSDRGTSTQANASFLVQLFARKSSCKVLLRARLSYLRCAILQPELSQGRIFVQPWETLPLRQLLQAELRCLAVRGWTPFCKARKMDAHEHLASKAKVTGLAFDTVCSIIRFRYVQISPVAAYVLFPPIPGDLSLKARIYNCNLRCDQLHNMFNVQLAN